MSRFTFHFFLQLCFLLLHTEFVSGHLPLKFVHQAKHPHNHTQFITVCKEK